MHRIKLFALLLLAAATVSTTAHAQARQPTVFKDISMIKPPAGAKVAIWEFEDLECPACAHAFPIVHQAVAKYKIPLVRKDYPLAMHVWSFEAAVNARWLQDNKGQPLADEYRGTIFAAQTGIASKADLQAYTQKWAGKHGIMWPFVVDPQGKLAAEVKVDQALGNRIGLQETPTIWVVTNNGIQHVDDINHLYEIIDAAIASTNAQAKAATSVKHTTAPVKK